jgi:hypothetical protein
MAKLEFAFPTLAPNTSARQPGIGECSVAVMPQLRSRANKCIRDNREWGRFSGIVLEGKMHEQVQYKVAVICVYARGLWERKCCRGKTTAWH